MSAEAAGGASRQSIDHPDQRALGALGDYCKLFSALCCAASRVGATLSRAAKPALNRRLGRGAWARARESESCRDATPLRAHP